MPSCFKIKKIDLKDTQQLNTLDKFKIQAEKAISFEYKGSPDAHAPIDISELSEFDQEKTLQQNTLKIIKKDMTSDNHKLIQFVKTSSKKD